MSRAAAAHDVTGCETVLIKMLAAFFRSLSDSPSASLTLGGKLNQWEKKKSRTRRDDTHVSRN